MPTPSALNLKMRERYGPIRLLQMTNENASSTTINDTVLNAACEDTIATFKRVSGFEFDVTNSVHVAIAIQGVVMFLELYKTRDGAIVSMTQTSFYNACEKLRKLGYTSPQAGFTYDHGTQAVPATMRDSDKRQPIYQIYGYGAASNVSDINEKEKKWLQQV